MNLSLIGAGEFTGKHTEFVKHCCRMHIQMKCTESGRKNQNIAKGKIGILPHRWMQWMTKKAVLKWLWDHGLIYESELFTHMACRHDCQTGYKEVMGQTLVINNWTQFEFSQFQT
jgi:hypothetical protein